MGLVLEDYARAVDEALCAIRVADGIGVRGSKVLALLVV